VTIVANQEGAEGNADDNVVRYQPHAIIKTREGEMLANNTVFTIESH
jgi:hypothetical protein